jgi:hypothetical protein
MRGMEESAAHPDFSERSFMSERLVFIGLDEAGLRQAEADRDRFALELAAKLRQASWWEPVPNFETVVKEAVSCDAHWPTR